MKNIELNFKRLSEEPYALNNLFQSADYDWPGDWEGRALLAFLCHYEISGSTVLHKKHRIICFWLTTHFFRATIDLKLPV